MTRQDLCKKLAGSLTRRDFLSRTTLGAAGIALAPALIKDRSSAPVRERPESSWPAPPCGEIVSNALQHCSTCRRLHGRVQ